MIILSIIFAIGVALMTHGIITDSSENYQALWEILAGIVISAISGLIMITLWLFA